MSSRTRTRGVKTAAGVHTVRIPRRRGRRGGDPFVVVVPERPSLTREPLPALGGAACYSAFQQEFEEGINSVRHRARRPQQPVMNWAQQ